MLNVGILGCGKMGKVYARWFDENPNTRLKLLYNRTFSTAERLAEQYDGCVAVRDWRNVVSDDKIDIVGICTPSNVHYEQVMLCAKNKKNVLLEKPMTGNVLEAARMKQATDEAGINMLVGFQMRFHPVVMKVSELLRDVGRIYSVDFYFGMYRPEVTWRHVLEQGGGVFKELGSHLVDLSRMWLGEIRRISSVNRIFQNGREVEDYCNAMLEFNSGACATIACNYWDRDSRAIRCRIMAENAQINFSFSSYDPTDSGIEWMDADGKKTIGFIMPATENIDAVYPGHLDSFKREIDFFVEAIRTGRDIRQSGVNGLKSMEATNAAYESQRLHKAIDNVYDSFRLDELKNSFIKQGDGKC